MQGVAWVVYEVVVGVPRSVVNEWLVEYCVESVVGLPVLVVTTVGVPGVVVTTHGAAVATFARGVLAPAPTEIGK